MFTRRSILQIGASLAAGCILPGGDFVRVATKGDRGPTRLAAAVHARTGVQGEILAAGTQAIVATDELNVRGGPDRDEPVVAVLSAGAMVDLLGRSPDGSWWRVVSGATVGYVSGAYLDPTGKPAVDDAFDLDLPVPYHRQLDPIWCDPADLQMWLEYRSGPPETDRSREVQQAFWNWELAHNAGFTVEQWDCSPYAVASAAFQWMPSTGFNHFRYDDALAGTRLMAWLIANPAYREPSIATIWRGDHYILVRGVRALGDPSRLDVDVRLLGLYVADPNKGRPSYLGQDRFISLDRWLRELFTPVTYLTPGSGVPGDVWQNRYVTVQRDFETTGPTPEGRLNATPLDYA